MLHEGLVEMHQHKLLQHSIKTLKVDVVLVIGHERLYSQISSELKQEKHMSLKVAMLLQRICRGRKARKVYKRKVKARERAIGKTASPYWKMDAIYKAGRVYKPGD